MVNGDDYVVKGTKNSQLILAICYNQIVKGYLYGWQYYQVF